MSRFPSLEASSLKWRSHCPPDVYIQREQQKEDLMSDDFVRDGYKYVKPVRDEYDSCKRESKFLNVDALRKFYRDAVIRKSEFSCSIDAKKRPSVNLRDSSIHIIDHNKTQISDWFKELAGSTSLHNLGKRVPYSKDKEEILNELVLNKVSVSRAVWLINISVIHATAHAENIKRKPRAPFDPTSDWTNSLLRLLEYNLTQLITDASNTAAEDSWNYLFILLVALYDADIADHWEVLLWLVKRAECIWNPAVISDTQASPRTSSVENLPILHVFLRCLLNFGLRFTENELVTRRLLFWSCKLFVLLVFKSVPVSYDSSAAGLKTILARYAEVIPCPIHCEVLRSISSLITSLTLRSPSSVVWNDIPFDTEQAYLKGSPLDWIPFSLSTLPLLELPETNSLRKFVLNLEETIITRSRLAELGWNRRVVDGPKGEHLNSLARLLDILDSQDYYSVQSTNPLDLLFNRVFNDESVNVDTSSVVNTLCEWAVSLHRVGIYRSIVVACLLEKLQNTFRGNPSQRGFLQETLMNFLDNFAERLPPFLTDQAPLDSQPMRSLVCLFAELIDREIFDHDAYVRRMIARGVFGTNCHPLAMDSATIHQAVQSSAVGSHTPRSRLNPFPLNNSTAQCSVASELSEDNERGSIDNPDSVRSELGLLNPTLHTAASLPCTNADRLPQFHYLAHFPIPQDETYSHEVNQRFQLLYGSTRCKDRARSRVRQLARDICKLFTRKIYLIDVVHGEMCRRKKMKDRDKEKDPSHTTTSASQRDDFHSIDKLHEDITARFLSLSFHDMECVISQCTPTYVKMLSGNCGVSGSNNEDHSATSINPSSPATAVNSTPSHIYMPVPNSIFLFFELIEQSLNITCLISTIVDSLERLQGLFKARTNFMALYMSFLFLRAIGILQRYQPVLFLMGNLSTRLFPTLITQVLQIKNPAQCRPFERCILAYINDLFTSNRVIRFRFSPSYGKAHPRVSTLFVSVKPSEGIGSYDPEYASDLLKASMLDNLLSLRACYEHLRGSTDARFSFVCKAIVHVCQASTIERVNYLCDLCAELTSQCPDLTPEWLGSLSAVLAPRHYLHSYAPIVSAVGPSDVYMYDNLSSLIGTLLSRHCFTIGDFLRHVLCPAMAQGLDQPVGPDLEPSIRLACHVLHRLFTAESTVSSLQIASTVLTPNREPCAPPPLLSSLDSVSSTPCFQISEPLLLTSALQKVTPELLVDVLKMLMVHNDKATANDLTRGVSDDGTNTGLSTSRGETDEDNGSTDSETDGEPDYPPSESSRRKRYRVSKRKPTDAKRNRPSEDDNRDLHLVVHRFLDSGVLPTVVELRSLPLSGIIQLVLREICTVPWVRDMFHRMAPKELICENVLIDEKFSPSQARRLLHIIFFPSDTSWLDVTNLPAAMCEVLSGLELWTLKCSQMKFELLHAQIPIAQRSDVLNVIGQSIVHGFQTQAIQWLNSNGFSGEGSFGPIGGFSTFEISDLDPVWLLSTLISKLPESVKVQIVRATSETLKGIKNFWKHKNDEDKENMLLNHSVILAHPAFAALLEKCLDIDPMDSLYEQIDYFVENARATRDRVPDNLRTRQIVQECLRLRLSLIGKRVTALQTDPEASTAWALLLTQLISHGVTEPESNTMLFYMVYDMLQTFVHALAAKSDKYYQNFVKKARRELIERPFTYGIEHVKPLLPPLKGGCLVVVTGKSGSQGNSSGPAGTGHSSGSTSGASKAGGSGKAGTSKGAGKCDDVRAASVTRGKARERSKGLSITAKERVAPWDLHDPTKQSLFLSMHAASRVEAIPSRTEEQANRLIRHDHFILMRRSPDFYLAPVYSQKSQNDVADEKADASNSRLDSSMACTPNSTVQRSPLTPSQQTPSTPTGTTSIIPGKGSVINRPDGKNRMVALQKHFSGGDPRAAFYPDSRDIHPSTQNYVTNAAGAPYTYQRPHPAYVSDMNPNAQLRPSGISSQVKCYSMSQFPQQMPHPDVYLMDEALSRAPPGKRRFVDVQGVNPMDVMNLPLEAAAGVARMTNKPSGESIPSAGSTPKRKRVSRRGSTSNAPEQRAVNSARMNELKMIDYPSGTNQHMVGDITMPSEGDQWLAVDPQQFRPSVPMVNIRGFIRNRAQQQQQQQRVSMQQQQLYADSTMVHPHDRSALSAYVPPQVQPADVASSSFQSATHNMTDYNVVDVRAAGTFPVGGTEQVPRQFTAVPFPQRYVLQQQRSGLSSTIPVPNPPPYPISQQNIMQGVSSNAPVAYNSRNAEDNYVFAVENDSVDSVFPRAPGQSCYRHPIYSSNHTQQSVTDPMATNQLIHPSQAVRYQRVPNSTPLVRPDSGSMSSQNATPQSYSRYIPY